VLSRIPYLFVRHRRRCVADCRGNRFIDQTSINSAGVRKTFTSGGQFEAAQRMGYQNNNSIFFIPKSSRTGGEQQTCRGAEAKLVL
jgi:hypothetical protein